MRQTWIRMIEWTAMLLLLKWNSVMAYINHKIFLISTYFRMATVTPTWWDLRPWRKSADLFATWRSPSWAARRVLLAEWRQRWLGVNLQIIPSWGQMWCLKSATWFCDRAKSVKIHVWECRQTPRWTVRPYSPWKIWHLRKVFEAWSLLKLQPCTISEDMCLP